MSWYSFRPYVPVAERRRKAEAAARKMTAKSGRVLAPVRLSARTIAATFWGKAWCDNLEAYSDFANRLPRGRTYVRNGSVIDLQILPGNVEALVQGSDLYKIKIGFSPLPPKRWKEFKARCEGRVANLLDLLQGKLSKDILQDVTTPGAGLFPTPNEIDLGCSCPDWAEMCKHVAAVLYGVGARLDQQPELFFTLRGVDAQELISAAATTTQAGEITGGPGGLDDSALGDIFGVEIETSGTPPKGMDAAPQAKSIAEGRPPRAAQKARATGAKKAPAKTAAKRPAVRSRKSRKVST